MSKVAFVYPTNRHQLISQVKRGFGPDNALYGANHLSFFGYQAKMSDVSEKTERILDILLAPFHKLFHREIDIDFKLPRALLLRSSINQADVVVTNTDGIGLAVCFLKRLKLVRPPIIYAVGLFYIKGKLKYHLDHSKKSLFFYLYKWILSAADQIIYHSPIEKQKLEKLGLYNPATCTFVAMGSDDTFFKSSKNHKSNLILSVGKDRARDYQTLFEAAERFPNLKFAVVCRKQNIEGLKVPKNVDLYFDISYRKVRDLYRKASVVVIPLKEMQRSSGQMTLTDSMQMQKPIIISDVVGIAHYPLKNFVNVIKIPPGDSGQLTQAISSTLQNKRLRQRLEKNSKTFAQQFSTRNYAKKIAAVIKWVTDPLQLKPIKEGDLEFIRKIRNQNRQFFLNNRLIAKEDHKRWFLNYKDKRNDYIFLLTDKNIRLGMGSIYNIDHAKSKAEIGRFIIDKDFQGQGYGKILLSKIEQIAFDKLHLKKIVLEVLRNNQSAINLYKKSKFQIDKKNNKKKTLAMFKISKPAI